MSDVLFESKAIYKTFGPTKALVDVSFVLKSGEIRGLIGENGSGKSTLSSIVAVVQHADAGKGEMYFNERPYNPKTILEAEKQGVCMIVQEQGTFTLTNVAENIFIGDESRFKRGGFISNKRMKKEADILLKSLGMGHIDSSQQAAELSYEDRKLCEVARAMYMDPQILIIDESTTALSHNGREIIYSIMKKMKNEGKGVIFISHDIHEVMEHCDTVSVLRDGHRAGELSKEEFNIDAIKMMMVGREIEGNFYRGDYEKSRGEEISLRVNDVCCGMVKNVSFDAYENEILGIGGLSDCGMHELGRALFGLDKLESGKITVGNKKYKNQIEAMKLGIGYMSKNRDKEAIMTAGSIRENICLPSLAKMAKAGFFVTNRAEKRFAGDLAKRLSIKMHNLNQYCMHLSGGNKQKVVVAKWLGFNPNIFIMDSPTRGIDIGVKADIYQLIENLKKEGKTIIMVSEELPELIGMCDRILVMKDGMITKEFARSKELSDKDVIHHMI